MFEVWACCPNLGHSTLLIAIIEDHFVPFNNFMDLKQIKKEDNVIFLDYYYA